MFWFEAIWQFAKLAVKSNGVPDGRETRNENQNMNFQDNIHRLICTGFAWVALWGTGFSGARAAMLRYPFRELDYTNAKEARWLGLRYKQAAKQKTGREHASIDDATLLISTP